LILLEKNVMLIVADNLNILDPEIARAVDTENPEPIQRCVRRCIDSGARAIDINSGPLLRRPEQDFTFLVEAVQAVTTLPLFLDTANPGAIEAGLAVCRNPAVINGFSLEPAKLEEILPLSVAYDTDIIGYLLDVRSRVPMERDEMMATAVALFGAYRESGGDPSRLIIDPVITPLSWEDGIRRNRSVIHLIRSLSDLLGESVRTVAGLSNLATGPIPDEKKAAVETAFLPMLAAAGLDMVLMNVHRRNTVQTAKAVNAMMGDGVFSWAEL